MTSRQLRLLRAVSASAVATLLAATSHTLAGGAAPHPLLVVAMAALLVPAAAALIGCGPSLSRLALTVMLSQAAFHLVFQLLGGPTAGTMVSGHDHDLDLSALGPGAEAASPDATMLAGHVLAAALTTALLWRGESFVRQIAGWMLALIRRAVTPLRAEHEPPAPLRSRLHPLVDIVTTATVSRRGPPALA